MPEPIEPKTLATDEYIHSVNTTAARRYTRDPLGDALDAEVRATLAQRARVGKRPRAADNWKMQQMQNPRRLNP